MRGEVTEGFFASGLENLVSLAEASGRLQTVAIDMPIGLPDSGRRQADVLARAAVGPRWPSVFMTPVRAAMQADSHAAAIVINRRHAGEGVSAQAFALRRKLFEVELWAIETSHRVIEVHPEVSFAALARGPLHDPKSTWAGAKHREQLLIEDGILLPNDFGIAGRNAGVDDVLDAAVAAWSARRFAKGEATSMPDPPEVFIDGRTSAIWA